MSDKSILTEEEIQTLILSLGMARKGSEFSEDEILVVVRWAEETSIGYALLQNVLHGTVMVDVKDGECVFDITDKGKKEVEEDILMNHPNFQTDLPQ